MELSTTHCLLVGVATILAWCVTLFWRDRFTFWARRGVPHPDPSPLFGNLGPIVRGQAGVYTIVRDVALGFRKRGLGYCGIYQMCCKPILLVWDPDMAKQILTQDFSSFRDRGRQADEHDPQSQNLVTLCGARWRHLRQRMTPTFTSGKLKAMLPLMSAVAEEMASVLAERADGGHEEVNVGDLLSRYATDVIGSVAFGIECHCLRGEGGEFLGMSRQILCHSPAQILRELLYAVHPKLSLLVPLRLSMGRPQRFFEELMSDTVRHRERQGDYVPKRNDFVQLLMELRNSNSANLDPANHVALTPAVMAAQAIFFFLAGLDNVAETVAFALSRLAMDPELQERAAAEVREALQRHGGLMTYEALQSMELVRCTVLEALRLWSPNGILVRESNATTRVGDLVVEKGMQVIIVSFAMHKNEDNFPEPKRFDPLRHAREARDQRHPYAFLPFGEGPRNCIAERFAMLDMQIAVATLLRDFTFSVGPNYEEEVELDPTAMFPKPKNGFKLLAKPREGRTLPGTDCFDSNQVQHHS